MRIIFLTVAFLLSNLSHSLNGQSRIDGNFPFQSDPVKAYSIYLPSSYSNSVPNRLILALHPFNTSRWNSVSWCDTLMAFAEANDLVLVCPDGGTDGRIDDPTDTAFTSALMDSMLTWFNIDTDKIYITGFSWGGKATYTFGLSHPEVFSGFIPVGALINGTDDLTDILQNAGGKPLYIIHGSLDNMNSRFIPVRDSLIENDAVVNWNVLQGVGHNFDFAGRDDIMTDAYRWVDSVNYARLSAGDDEQIKTPELFYIYPNPATDKIIIESRTDIEQMFELIIYNSTGEKILSDQISNRTFGTSFVIDTGYFEPGLYYVIIRNNDVNFMHKFFIR